MSGFEKQIGAWMYGLLQRMEGTTSDGRRYNKYLHAVFQKGGCEGWVQVELAMLFDTIPWCRSVEREQAVFQDQNKSVDFLLGYQETNRSVTPRLVELKCESLFQSSGLGRATMPHKQYQLVDADVQKLRAPRLQQFAGAPSCVLVVTFSQEAEAGMDEYFREPLAGDPEAKQTYDAEHLGEYYRIAVYAVRVT